MYIEKRLIMIANTNMSSPQLGRIKQGKSSRVSFLTNFVFLPLIGAHSINKSMYLILSDTCYDVFQILEVRIRHCHGGRMSNVREHREQRQDHLR